MCVLLLMTETGYHCCCVFVLYRGGEVDESGLLAKETAERQAGACSALISYLRRSLKTKEDGGGVGGGDSSSNGSPGMGGPFSAEVQAGAVQQTQGAVRKGGHCTHMG